MTINWQSIVSLDPAGFEAFKIECDRAGLPKPRGTRNGVLRFTEQLTADQVTTLEKVVLAHGAKLTDQAALDLRDHLGDKSAEWTAYQAAVNAETTDTLKEEYQDKTDHILMDLLARAQVKDIGGEKVLCVDPKLWDDWVAARQAIKDAL